MLLRSTDYAVSDGEAGRLRDLPLFNADPAIRDPVLQAFQILSKLRNVPPVLFVDNFENFKNKVQNKSEKTLPNCYRSNWQKYARLQEFATNFLVTMEF